MTRTRAAVGAVVAAALVAPQAACSRDASQDTVVTVFAAASLKESFTELGHQYEKAHPGVKVQLSFEGSQTLVEQLANGAPADLLATADATSMGKATAAGTVPSPREFATNQLTLVVPPGNPAHVTGLDGSLAHAKLVICAPEVPCGRATATLARSAGVTLHPVSEEEKVTDVRGKVESGEADAGVVYRTDAHAAGANLVSIPIAGADQAANTDLIGVTTDAKQPDRARELMELVLSDEGRKVLADAGFSPPRG